jgi:hypothetical protein
MTYKLQWYINLNTVTSFRDGIAGGVVEWDVPAIYLSRLSIYEGFGDKTRGCGFTTMENEHT